MDSKLTNGWFYSPNFKHFQRVSNQVYCYIAPIIGGYDAKLYLRGTTAFCELDVRTENNIEKLFELTNSWLEKYSDGNVDKLRADYYHIANPKGVWSRDKRDKKEYWI